MSDAVVTISARSRTAKGIKAAKKDLDSLSRSASKVGRIFGVAVGVESARRFALLSDKVQALETRVRTATKSTGDYDTVMRQLRETAILTGSDLETTISSFQDLARVREELGATNQDMVELNRLISQLGVIGGSSTEAMKFGMRQFNQAMSAGVFRAEEWNSIVENMPEVAARIADGLHMSVGELRQMVIAGELASKDVFDVLLKQAPEIAQEFTEIPVTIARATESFQTAFSKYLNDLDDTLNLTGTVAKAIQGVAEQLSPSTDNLLDDYADMRVELADMRKEYEAILARLTELRSENQQNIGAIVKWENRRKDLAHEIFELEQEAFGIAKQLLDQRQKQVQAEEEQAAALERQVLSLREIKDLTGVDVDDGLFGDPFSINPTAPPNTVDQYDPETANNTDFEPITTTEIEILIERNEEVIRLEEERWQRLRDIAQAGVRDIQDIQELHHNWELMSWDMKANAILSTATFLTSSLASNSETAFKINKVAGIANALVEGYGAVQKAWNLPYPANIAAAAFVAAKTAANVASIRATQFRGGGNINVSGGGSAIPSQNRLPALPDPTLPGNNQSGQNVTIQIVGDVFSLDGSEFADKTVEAIKRFTDADGVIINTGTRQATELRL